MQKHYLHYTLLMALLLLLGACRPQEVKPVVIPVPADEQQVLNTARVRTTIRIFYDCGFGRSMFVTGGHEGLDNWTAPGKSCRWTTGNVWVFETFDIAQGQSFEFKAIRANGGNSYSWENGANRVGTGGQTIDIYPNNNSFGSSVNIDLFANRIRYHQVQGWADIPGRNITVVLPPAYSTSQTYPVVYMQDGKNCLDWDPFGNGGWQVHRTSDRMMRANEIEKVIFVLIDNMGDGGSGQRVYEYSPVQDPTAPPFYGGTVGGGADNYIGFVLNRVMPIVNSQYRVRTGAANCAIAGSSFGGLLSFYAGWKYPQHFGRVIAMSSYFVWRSNWILGYANGTTAPLASRIYIDSGDNSTIPFFGDDGRSVTGQMRDIMRNKGFVQDQNLRHHFQSGANHSESTWRARFNVPLLYHFRKA